MMNWQRNYGYAARNKRRREKIVRNIFIGKRLRSPYIRVHFNHPYREHDHVRHQQS